MNDDRIHDVLNDGVPPAPSPMGWARKAARRSTVRRATVGVAALLAVVALPAAFLLNGDRPLIATPSPSPTNIASVEPTGEASQTSSPLAPEGEVVGQADIYQDADADLPTICLNVVGYSDPPVCQGDVVLKGDFSWDDVAHTNTGGTRWAESTHIVVGRLDLTDGEHGSLTLTRPLDSVPESALPVDDPPPPDVEPELDCEDPLRDADEKKTRDEIVKGQQVDPRDLVRQALEGVPVVSFTGTSRGLGHELDDYGFYVYVQGDTEGPFQKVREVWGGPLCVVSSDQPTEAEREAEAERVQAALPAGLVISITPGGREFPQASLGLNLVYADDAVRAAVREIVGEELGVRVRQVFGPLQGEPSTTAATTLPPQPDEVVGVVDIYQYADEELPHLCFGIVMQSAPPRCDGPTLLGDFSWDDIRHAEHGRMRWTEEGYEVIGFFDPTEGDAGTFTLTRPIRQKDRVYDDEPLPDLPQLCEDPWLDADPSKTDNDAAHAFRRVVDGELPMIQVWSNGEEAEQEYGFNVLVQGDAEKAFRAIREVWGGWLCVGSSDEPTEKERHAAFDRMVDALPPNTMVSGSAGGIERVLELEVVVADDALKSKLKEAAGDDFEVRLTEVFTPWAP